MGKYATGLIIAISAIAGVLFSPGVVNAAVGTGANSSPTGSCNRGGIAGCPWTTNDFGWYMFALNDPNAPRGNAAYFNAAHAACSAQGTSHVVAFVILTGERTWATGWIWRFMDPWEWDPYPHWGGNEVGNVSKDSAKAMYDTLPASEKSGFIFGGDGVNTDTGNVGWFCYNVAPPPWDTAATTNRTVDGVDTSTGAVGQVIRWDHTLILSSNPNHVPIYGHTFSDGFSNGWNGIANGATIPAGRSPGVLRTITSSPASHTQYTIIQADVGNTLCQQLQWDPTSSTGGRHGRSTNQCVSVAYDYMLTPSIGPVTNATDLGALLTIQGTIHNSGPTKSHPTDVRYYRVVNPTRTTAGTTAGTGCTFYGGTHCQTFAVQDNYVFNHGSGDSGGAFTNRTYAQPSLTDTVPDDLNPGDRVCYGAAVSGYDASTGAGKTGTSLSDLECTIVKKAPAVQIWGGNVSVGQGWTGGTLAPSTMHTSLTRRAAGNFGSWGEYGLFAPSTITNTASASGLSSGAPSPTQADWSRLTFTGNNPSPDAFGFYNYGASVLPNTPARFPYEAAGASTVTTLNPAAHANSPTTGNRTLSVSSSTLTLQGGTLNAGRWLVITAPYADVRITGNLGYTSAPLTAISEIPQLVIIARNITIASNVERVDAWLIARPSGALPGVGGAIATCDQGGDAAYLSVPANYAGPSARLTFTTCNNPLRINGPVIADRLFLRRTAGSGAGPAAADAAEVINFRADAYLWAQRTDVGTRSLGVTRTASIRELPVRY